MIVVVPSILHLYISSTLFSSQPLSYKPAVVQVPQLLQHYSKSFPFLALLHHSATDYYLRYPQRHIFSLSNHRYSFHSRERNPSQRELVGVSLRFSPGNQKCYRWWRCRTFGANASHGALGAPCVPGFVLLNVTPLGDSIICARCCW